MLPKQSVYRLVLILSLLLGLTACTSNKSKEPFKRPSQDGHPSRHMIPKNLDRIPDAEPKVEPLSRYGNRFKKNSTNTYVALKKKYAVMPSSKGYKARGQASWYGTKFQGRKTSSGEAYDMFAMTAAHRTLPLPTYARVTNVDNGKSIVVKVNDRGPFHNNRLIDLSYVAAHKLGIIGHGTGRVEVESVDPRDHHGIPRKERSRMKGRSRLVKNSALAATIDDQEQLNPEMNINNSKKAAAVATATAVAVSPKFQGKVLANTAVNKESTNQAFKSHPVVKQELVQQNIAKLETASKLETAKNTLGKKGKIFLQLGAFNQKGNAEEMAKKIGSLSSSPTQIAENKTQKGARYRVRIGPFNSREEAQLLSQKLSKQEFPKPVVLAD